jgi:hypothetical protein
MAMITIDVDLIDFDDADIIEEYESRGLGDAPSDDERKEILRSIHQLMLHGRNDEAQRMMYDYIRDELGLAI